MIKNPKKIVHNKLFESIIRTCGADTDDIHSMEAEDNFLADNQLFEAILSEISTYRFFGIFSLKICVKNL
jgi:hypothetical protein